MTKNTINNLKNIVNILASSFALCSLIILLFAISNVDFLLIATFVLIQVIIYFCTVIVILRYCLELIDNLKNKQEGKNLENG